ncbi:MAG: hypothetical protein MJY88_02865 [Bacteroidales bacterium]|nr:hypothetical protein [Bacteroidales bacterium]
MRIHLKYLYVLALVAAIVGCVKPSNDDGPGNKPGTENPGNTDPGNTDPGNADIPQWNTTGEYIVPEETAKINPNIFVLKTEETKVVSSDKEAMTVRLRFEKAVPKLYGGALIQYTDKDGESCLHFVRKVSFSGNEADITYRNVLINEVFYNQRFVISTDPSGSYFKAEDMYSPGPKTKADDNTSFAVDFVDLICNGVEIVPGVHFTHDTEMKLDIDIIYDSGKPVKKDDLLNEDGEEDLFEKLLRENQEQWLEDNKDIIGDLKGDEPPTSFAQIKELGAVLHGKLKLSDILEIAVNDSVTADGTKDLGTPVNKWIKPTIVIHGLPVPIHFKLSFGLSGSAGITTTYLAMKYGLETTVTSKFGVIYHKDSDIEVVKDFNYGFNPISENPDLANLELELKASVDMDMTVAAYGTLGIKVGVSPFVKLKANAFLDRDKNLGFEGLLCSGWILRGSLVTRALLSKDEDPYTMRLKIPDITLNELPIYKLPDSMEPVEPLKASDLTMGYSNKETVKMKVNDKDVANDVKVPTKKALVKVEVLSNMPEGTKGTTKTKDGITSHGVLFYDADGNGEVSPEFKVPGPMQYDFTFKTSIVGGDKDKDGEGDDIYVKKFYPINRFKSYTATYSASDCAGTTTITVDSYGEKITEKGKLKRTAFYDGYPVVQTYVVDSDFDELFEITDVQIGDGITYVTANLKYYAGECLYDPVIEKLDYIRWDQDENGNRKGFTFTECNYQGFEKCVHAIGGSCSPFFAETDIIYWQNIPVHVATGYLDPDCTEYSYLSIEDYTILDDGSKDREANDGDTNHEIRPDIPADALEDDGLWGGFIGGGGDDDDKLSGYYVRVDSEPESWEGKYLIVYDETKANSWEEYDSLLPGNLSNIYSSWNGQGTYAENGRILVTSANENSYFTISRLPDGKYAIYSSKDFYLGCKDSENAAFDKWAEDPVPNSITYDAANKCVLIQGYYNHTLCYDTKWHQFVYVPWTSYSAGEYMPIQLFKLHE